MAKTLLTFVCLIAGVSFALAHQHWSYYQNPSNGPDNWDGVCATGMKQSPIDINTTTAMYNSSLGDFTLVNYDTIPADVTFTAKNDGTTLKISFDSDVYYVSGGGLPGRYTTVQFHLHWGLDNNQGSEHTMNEMMYPAEIHFVSYNTEYHNLSESLPHSNGLAVLGVFLQVGSSNPYYEKFLNTISSVMNKGQSTTFPAFKLMDLLPTKMTKYYRYPGSLTTPPCSEAVTWTVFKDPVMVSQEQLDALRSMNYNATANIINNYRPVQMLNNRTVQVSKNISLRTSTTMMPSTTAPAVTTDGVALKISNVVLLLMLLLGVVFLH